MDGRARVEALRDLGDLDDLRLVGRIHDDPAGAFAGQRHVAAHQRDLVAEAGGAAGVAHHLVQVGEELARREDEDVVGAEAGVVRRLGCLARRLVVGERQDRVPDRVEGAQRTPATRPSSSACSSPIHPSCACSSGARRQCKSCARTRSLERLLQPVPQLADDAAPEREHADHEDHALHHRHPGAELRQVVLHA